MHSTSGILRLERQHLLLGSSTDLNTWITNHRSGITTTEDIADNTHLGIFRTGMKRNRRAIFQRFVFSMGSLATTTLMPNTVSWI